MLDETIIPIVLGLMFLAAAGFRYKVLVTQPLFKATYIVSIVCCLIYTGSYLWLLKYGDSPERSRAMRYVGLVSTYVVYIWAPWRAIKVEKIRQAAVQAASAEVSKSPGTVPTAVPDEPEAV